ncbi:MAG: ATP-binding protein [Sulfuricurvum sp.]|jgi:hypothetical protein
MSMEEITLPKRFKDKLDNSNKKFNAIITEILSNFEIYLNVSTLEFFPEYNNHGITHLNNIFKIQDELISEKSFDLLTPEDITTLVIATLSHDIGMHLNYDGFLTLINAETVYSEIWREKWENFFQLSKKYNESKLVLLFGNTKPITNFPEKKQDFEDRDYRLVGEFLRINHPLLAEEILKFGFPIANDNVEIFSPQLQKEEKILGFSSLLAKSHGMNLRDTFEEIQSIGYEGDLLSPHNTHIVYLMVILRLSDYLDICKSRNPRILLGLKNFISDISKFEWEKNISVSEIKGHWDDNEAVFIGVEPKDSRSFVNLKNLFKSIQYEFDISWAVLGEIYSKDTILKEFSIKYRRILSNIDNEDAFRKKVNYLPRKISFDSDPDLLKLLIAPLYGNNPSYGVRELLQNAVDACKEFQELSKEGYKPKIKVNAIEENNYYYFEIIDNGLGMTEDTIINYFLKAGASFRNSDFWMEKLKDENNKSKVVRTGRFGVGLLAAFLFGSKIEVRTRSTYEEIGYSFKTHLSDSQINIIKDADIDVGTTIKIEMNKDIFDKLINGLKGDRYDEDNKNWKEWYLLNDIDILYNGEAIKNAIDEKKYFKLEQDEYTYAGWFFEDKGKEKEIFTCNGFKIPNANVKLKSLIDMPFSRKTWNGHDNMFNTPSFLITDKEGKLPLSLSRETLLTHEFSLNDIVIKSMSNELHNSLINYKVDRNNLSKNIFLNHPMFKERYWNNDDVNHTRALHKKFIFYTKGFNLLNSYIIEKSCIKKLVFIEFNDNESINNHNDFIKQLLNDETPILCNHSDIIASSSGYNYLLRIMEEGLLRIDKDFKIDSANIFIPKEKHKNLLTFKTTHLNIGFKNQIITATPKHKKNREVIPPSEESKFFSKSHFISENKSLFNLKDLDQYIDDIGLIVEMYIDHNPKDKNDIEFYFNNLMEEHFANQEHDLIPYTE